MVHGRFRTSGIVMIYRLHHEFGPGPGPAGQFRMPGSFQASSGGSVLESAEGLSFIYREICLRRAQISVPLIGNESGRREETGRREKVMLQKYLRSFAVVMHCKVNEAFPAGAS
jgi:hypothetical protein